jgi:glycosyltransferase involved in cell wall biosynthesis
MSQAGHQVRIIAARGEPWAESIRLIRLPLIDSRHPRVLALKADLDRGDIPADFEALTSEIAAALRTACADVDVLIAHNVCSLNKNLALTAAIQRIHHEAPTPRLILWHHDLAWTTPRYRPELHEGYPWDLLRTDWGARHIVVSELRRHELAELMHIPIKSITIVPNGVDQVTFLKSSAQTQTLIEKIDLFNAAPILLLPVRLTPRKNIELALHVLAELRREFSRAMLVVTGPLGPHNLANVDYFTRLKNLRAELNLSGAAHFLAELSEDYLSDEVIADFYRVADVLILSSREEGFGIPVIEAAFSRLPVFCADIPPLHDLGHNDVTYFSPDDDPESIAVKIAVRLRTDPVYRLAARARQSFTWDRIYADHIAPLLEEQER